MELDMKDGSFTSKDSLFHRKRRSRTNLILVVAILLVCCVALGLGLGLGLASSGEDSASQRQKRAAEILNSVPLIDGHNDLPWQYRTEVSNKVWDIDLQSGWLDVNTDIPRIEEGKLGAQFWSAYVSCESQYKDAVRQSLDQVDTIKKMTAKYPDTFRFVTTAQGIEEAFKEGLVSSLIGLEGGHSIDSSLGNLRMFYELGVRYMTLTHSCNTPWADNWLVDDIDPETGTTTYEFDGLTEFGELVVKEMNRIGMMVDLSHVAVETMKDALAISEAPVIFSHSSVYQLCPMNRNVRDDVLQMVKDNEGVVMINFFNDYVTCSESATVEDVANHIDYIKDLIGADYVGIGSDYDGVERLPTGLEDVSKFPNLFEVLLSRGWSDDDLKKVAGENLLRVFAAVEATRDKLANMPPYEDLIDSDTWVNETCRTGI